MPSNQCLLTLLKPSPCTWIHSNHPSFEKTRSKISLWSLRCEYVLPLYFLTKNNHYLTESLLDGTLWNLLLAGKRGLFHKAISLAVLDNASNQQHQTAQMTQMIISLGYYPHSQLRNTGCYPMRKCDMGVE